jgi:hypothetical protein
LQCSDNFIFFCVHIFNNNSIIIVMVSSFNLMEQKWHSFKGMYDNDIVEQRGNVCKVHAQIWLIIEKL